jgi:hypothetical protein
MPSKISSVSLLSDSASPSSYDAEQKHEDGCFPSFSNNVKIQKSNLFIDYAGAVVADQ